MDAETKEYLDGMLAEVLTALNAGFDRLGPPAENPGSHAGASSAELEDRLLSVEERFRTLKLQVESADGRSEYLAVDMRTQVRHLGNRIAALERRLDTQENITRPPLREATLTRRGH